jgi:hypothetical protein
VVVWRCASTSLSLLGLARTCACWIQPRSLEKRQQGQRIVEQEFWQTSVETLRIWEEEHSGLAGGKTHVNQCNRLNKKIQTHCVRLLWYRSGKVGHSPSYLKSYFIQKTMASMSILENKIPLKVSHTQRPFLPPSYPPTLPPHLRY